MSHYNLVDGNVVLTEHDIAEVICESIEKTAIIGVHSEKTDKGVSIKCFDEKDNHVSLTDNPGLYLIYKKGDFNQYECIYSGSGNIRYRVYRFMKELHDMSRDDETHPAAKKARRFGLDRDGTMYVRYIEQGERDSIVVNMLCKHLNLKNIDEHIAHFCNARFNKRVKKA